MDIENDVGRCRSRLDRALAMLDPLSRRVMCAWLEGKADDEMAASLGLPERILAGLRARALAGLRDAIARQTPPEGPDPAEGPTDSPPLRPSAG